MPLNRDLVLRCLDDPDLHMEAVHRGALKPLQGKLISTAERAIDGDRTQDQAVACLRACRQFGKNEAAAFLHYRTACRYYHRGGMYVRAAPTWRPQIVRSIMRVQKYLRSPSLVPRHNWRMGYILEAGKFQMDFYSADKTANVVGGTASLGLDIDEAHEVDVAKFENDFAPMAASTNAPLILWGVAAQGRDLLSKYRQRNIESGRSHMNVDITAEMVAEFDPIYAAHYASRCAQLGKDHPIIKNNYDLIDTDDAGRFFSPAQGRMIKDSDYPRLRKRPDSDKNVHYVAVIDIAGENEEGEIIDPDSMADARRDSTTALLVRVDYTRMKHDWPKCEIVQAVWWVGKALGEDPTGLPGQQEELLTVLRAWGAKRTVVDARGVGEQIAMYLKKRWPGVDAYKATAETVDSDCNALLAVVNQGQLKLWQNDKSTTYKEIVRQIGHVDFKVSPNGRTKLCKPKNDPTAHIDFVKAMSYIPRAIVRGNPLAMVSRDTESPL